MKSKVIRVFSLFQAVKTRLTIFIVCQFVLLPVDKVSFVPFVRFQLGLNYKIVCLPFYDLRTRRLICAFVFLIFAII